jgi:hypothetical protein
VAKQVVAVGQLTPNRLSVMPPGEIRDHIEPPLRVRITLPWAPAAKQVVVVLAQLTPYQGEPVVD